MSKSKSDLLALLKTKLPDELANDLTEQFIGLRNDVATHHLGGGWQGKFVETFVQLLQFLHSGKYEKSPNVDAFLRTFDSQASSVGDGLRVCGSRLARGVYALRSKRNVVHKGEVDMNLVDLRMCFAGAQWLLSELVREIAGTSMADAGKIIEDIHVPVTEFIENIGGRALVLASVNVNKELLLLLHSVYPGSQRIEDLQKSMSRRNPKTISNVMRSMWTDKHIEKVNEDSYKLTLVGYSKAVNVIRDLNK